MSSQANRNEETHFPKYPWHGRRIMEGWKVVGCRLSSRRSRSRGVKPDEMEPFEDRGRIASKASLEEDSVDRGIVNARSIEFESFAPLCLAGPDPPMHPARWPLAFGKQAIRTRHPSSFPHTHIHTTQVAS